MKGMTRRRFLQYSAGAGVGLALPWAARTPPASAAPGLRLTKYLEPVPLPGAGIVVATPSGTNEYSFVQRPSGPYEIPLVVQDRQFNADGTFLYPTSDISGATSIGEYFGDAMLVNGKVWPFLEVEPRLYRFRILNGCNARILNLDIGGARMWQIGAEGGMWDQPVPVSQLVLAPAERADVLVDFSHLAGATLLMKNLKPPSPVSNPAPPLAAVMQIRVGKTTPIPPSIPTTLVGGRMADLHGPVTTRYITLNEIDVDEPTWFLNLNGIHFEDGPVTETPQVGTVEDWVYVNVTGDTHPMHTHLVTFQVVGRTPFDAA